MNNKIKSLWQKIVGRILPEKVVYLIEEPLRCLSEDVIKYSSDLQMEVHRKNKATTSLYIHAVERLHMQAVNYYQAVGRLCELGWAHTTQPLSRVILECLANLFVICDGDSTFRAFKWIAHEHFYLACQENRGLEDYPETNNQGLDVEIIKKELKENLYDSLSDPDKKRADDYMDQLCKKKKPDLYWYNPEYKGPRDVLKKCAPNLLLHYNLGGNASHASTLGYDFFRTPEYEASITPRYDSYNANLCLLASTRYLLELCYLRDKFERCGFDKTYERCFTEIGAVANVVRGLKKAKN